jgi:hypothetical protein
MKQPADRQSLLPLWMGAAAIVAALRCLQAADPGYDLGLQLQAAHNLLRGRGLATFLELGPNLSSPNVLTPLTYFPAGYSLMAAGLFAAGLGVGTSLKVLGAAATVLGWWGWGRLAQYYFAEALARPLWKRAAIVIALSAPLLFTQPWGGTDIFLWAVVPWLIECTSRAANDETATGRKFDWLAGTLCGFAFLMRYASVFLVAYEGCVVLWQSRLRARPLIYRSLAFGAGFLPALILQGYFNYGVGAGFEVVPGGLFTTRASVISRLGAGIPTLRNANYLWAFWMPGKIASVLFPVRAGLLFPLLGLLLVAFALLLLAFKTYGDFGLTSRDRRLVALGLFPAIPLFLWGCMTLSAANYLGDLRYFWPVVPLSVLVAYSIASIDRSGQRTGAGAFLRPIAAVYACAYVVMCLVYLCFLVMPNRIGMSQREKLMAGSFDEWPSTGVTYEHSAARQYVLRQLQDDPAAVLVTSKAAAFFWDPAVDASRLHDANCGGSEPRYFEGPAKILIFTFDEGGPDDVWRYDGNSTLGYRARATCFERLRDRRVLRRFPNEGMKLLEATVARGERISLN